MRDWSVRGKLLGGFGFVGLCCVIVGLGGYISVGRVVENMEHISQINLMNMITLGEMRDAARQWRLAYNRMGLPTSTERVKLDAVTEIDEAIDRYIKSDAQYKAVPFVAGEQELYDPIEQIWKSSVDLMTKMKALGSSEKAADQRLFQELLTTEFRSLGKKQFEALTKLMKFQTEQSKIWAGHGQEAATVGRTVATVVTLIGSICALMLGFLISTSLTRVLGRISLELSGEAESVAGAATEISEASTELSASSTQQAAAVQETASSVDEINAMVNRNAENAQQSQEVSRVSLDAVEKAKVVIGGLIESVKEIGLSNSEVAGQIENSNREIGEIVKVITEIGAKTKVINDIVFQTKLLSFNASVEAARAGEQGKGFAVVAEEVGNLAQMSGNAAREISSMLDGSIKRVEEIVRNTQDRVGTLITKGKAKVETGLGSAKLCGEALAEIVTNVTRVNTMVSEIAVASKEQADGVLEINRAMGELDKVTQQNSSATRQASVSAEQLSKQAETMRNLVVELNYTVEGRSGHALEQKAHGSHEVRERLSTRITQSAA